MSDSSDNVQRLVLAPDVLARSFNDDSCRAVLELWRDGKVQLVVTRELLAIYLKTLKRLGIPDEHLRCWIVWFTLSEHTRFFGETQDQTASLTETLLAALECGQACAIITANITDPSEAQPWLTPGALINNHPPQP